MARRFRSSALLAQDHELQTIRSRKRTSTSRTSRACPRWQLNRMVSLLVRGRKQPAMDIQIEQEPHLGVLAGLRASKGESPSETRILGGRMTDCANEKGQP